MRRRLAGGLVVVVCAASTVFLSRRLARPDEPAAPEYRRRGPSDAPIKIVEFSDFQCPHCAAAEPALRQLLAVYGGKIRLTFKHFPIAWVHPRARAAAKAAECAGEQGKFWELHDVLFAEQAKWAVEPSRDWKESDPRWPLAYARKAGVDLDALESCMAKPEVDAAIDKDLQDARDRWVGGAPTFFVNGRRFVGGRQLAQRAPRWIDRQLKRR